MVRFRDFRECLPFCDRIRIIREYAKRDVEIYSGRADLLEEKLDQNTADYINSDGTAVIRIHTDISYYKAGSEERFESGQSLRRPLPDYEGVITLEIYVFNAKDR